MAQKPGGKSLTSVKLLPLLAWEYAGLLSACMHSLDVIPSVPLRAEGKPKALKLLVEITGQQRGKSRYSLSREWDLSQELMDKLEAFTCLLYAPKLSSTRINELRYHLKKGEIESHQLPPCKDCLVQIFA